jgi:hypothetical protein
LAERRVFTFKSEGLDYDVQAKRKVLDSLIVDAKLRAKQTAVELDVLRAIARDYRDADLPTK